MDRHLLEVKREAQILKNLKLIDDFEFEMNHTVPRMVFYIGGTRYWLRVCMRSRTMYSPKIIRQTIFKVVRNSRSQGVQPVKPVRDASDGAQKRSIRAPQNAQVHLGERWCRHP